MEQQFLTIIHLKHCDEKIFLFFKGAVWISGKTGKVTKKKTEKLVKNDKERNKTRLKRYEQHN